MKPLHLNEAVEQFMTAAGQTTDTWNSRQTMFYLGMCCEELAEGLYLVGLDEEASYLQDLASQLKANELTHMLEARSAFRYVRKGLLDHSFDLAWVATAAAFSQGADVRGAWAEGIRSNMSKFIIGPEGLSCLRDERTGKVLKPETFSPPNFAPFINQSGTQKELPL